MMSDGRAWVAGAILGGSVLIGVLRGTGSSSTAPILRFPSHGRPAFARIGHRIALAPSADEALARVAFLAYEESLSKTGDLDEAYTFAWRTVEPLVDRHRFELEGQGELVSDLLERAARVRMSP